MRTALALAASVLITTSTQAAPQLLAEFEYAYTEWDVGASRNTWLAIVTPPKTFMREWSESEAGQTISLDQATVDAMEPCLTNTSGCYFALYTQDLFHSSGSVEWLPQPHISTIAPGVGSVTLHVPQFGPALNGYDITSITQTLDESRFYQEGNYWLGYAKQTASVYGEAIPEPASWLLACPALCLLQRRPYRTHHWSA